MEKFFLSIKCLGLDNIYIFQFGMLESLTAVRRAFMKKFYSTNSKAVSNLKAFQRIVDRFVKFWKH